MQNIIKNIKKESCCNHVLPDWIYFKSYYWVKNTTFPLWYMKISVFLSVVCTEMRTIRI